MTAEEMRAIANTNGRSNHEAKAYAYFDQKIMAAAKEGKCQIFFGFDGGYPEENKWVSRSETHITREDAKKHYKQLGYRFEHVGVIGGVMQASDEEYICW